MRIVKVLYVHTCISLKSIIIASVVDMTFSSKYSINRLDSYIIVPQLVA